MKSAAKPRVHRNNVFRGQNGLKQYLDPTKNPDTPLVELPNSLNPYRGDGVRIFVKMPPPLSSKQFGLTNMLRERSMRPGFRNIKKTKIRSSGNAAVVVGINGNMLFGIKHAETVLPASIAPGKREFLRICGIKTMLDNELPEGFTDPEAYVRDPGKNGDAWNVPQYEDDSNTRGYRALVTQCKRQTRGKMKLAAFGLGTSATGNAFAEERANGLICIGGYSSPDDATPGTRSKKRLKKVRLHDPKKFDHLVMVKTYWSYKRSMALCRHGLLLGPSSGQALEALLKTIAKLKKGGKLKRLLDKNAELIAVVVGHDGPFLYLEKYSTQLHDKDF